MAGTALMARRGASITSGGGSRRRTRRAWGSLRSLWRWSAGHRAQPSLPKSDARL
jgi:hypothetical protein